MAGSEVLSSPIAEDGDVRMRAQGCGDVPRVAPGSPHPPSLLHARACSAALFTKSLEMRRRFFNDYYSAKSRFLNM